MASSKPGPFGGSYGNFSSFPTDTQDSNTVTGDTQPNMQIPPPPKPKGNKRRESSFLVMHPFEPPPPVSVSGRLEPTTPKDDRRYVLADYGNATVEALWDDSVHVRVQFWNEDNTPHEWIELQEHEYLTDDEDISYTIRVGQDRTGGNPKVTSEITDHNNFGKQVKDRSSDWYSLVTGLLASLRNAAHLSTETNERVSELTDQLEASQSTKGTVPSSEYKAKCTELRKLQDAMTKVKAGTEIQQHPAFVAVVKERDAATADRNDLRQQVKGLSQQVDKQKEQVTTANAEADKYDRQAEEEWLKAKERLEIIKQKDEDLAMLTKDRDTADARADKAIIDMQAAQRETKNLLAKVQQGEPSYRPYSFLPTRDRNRLYPRSDRERTEPEQSVERERRREDTGRERRREDSDRDRFERYSTSPIRDLRDERVNRDHFFNNLGNPRPRSSVQPASNPYGPAQPSYQSELGPPGGSYPPGMAPTSYKMPEIEVFKGEADQDYERWRETAVDKCNSIPDESLRISYLKTRIGGNAWPIIKKMRATAYLDYLEALDGTYLTYDQFGEAETALVDGSLKQKTSETFAAWQARFLGVANVLHAYPQRTLIKKARALMSHRLGNSMASNPIDTETLAQFLRRARAIDEATQDVELGKNLPSTSRSARPTTTSSTKRDRTKDRTPEQRQRSSRYVERRVKEMRTASEKQTLRDRSACFKCGKTGHNQYDAEAPCKGKPITPSSEISGLHAMDAEESDEAEEEEYNDLVEDSEDDQGHF
jgi:uncharacterized coiled-coil DUF342 family protein